MPPRKRKRATQPQRDIHIQASATVGQAEGSQVTGAVVNAPDAQSLQIGDRVAGDQHNVDTGGGDYAEGNIDKCQGAFVADSTIHGDVIGQQIIQQTPPIVLALHQLRAPIGDFVGREHEIAQLLQAARRGAAAAISGVRGMGGIGKTELAYKVAHELASDFPDAQLVVDLRGASDPVSPVQALQTVIRAFEPEMRLGDDLAELQSRYRSHLGGKRALILADDARDAAQVRPLLPPPGSALLVTSRYRFTLPGMHAIDLGILAPKEAEALLLTICPRIGEAAPALAKLCGYLPLALRVSAGLQASDATLPVARYLKQLADEQRLAALRDPDDRTLDVEAVLVLSYAALDPAAQAVLCQLSVFVADFDLLASQAVVMLEGERLVEAVLGDLYRRSLLDYDAIQERYSLHDLVKVFARARLDAEASEPLMLRYAQHYAQIANQADRLYLQGGESTLLGLALFDRERAHIDATWAWARGQAVESGIDALVIHFAGATAHIGNLRYHMHHERIPQLEAALLAAERGRRRADQGWLLGNLGNAYATLGEVQRAIDSYEQRLVIARELGDRQGEGRVLGNLGLAYAALGEVQHAIDSYEQSLIITREVGDRRGEGNTLGNLGGVYYRLGEVQHAIGFYEQQLAIVREIGDRGGEGRALGGLGIAYYRLGEVHQAIGYYKQWLAIARAVGDQRGEVQTLNNLGLAYAALGEVRRAIDSYEQQLMITCAIGDRGGEGKALGNLGGAYYTLGEMRQAIEFYEQQLVIAREVGDRQDEGNALGGLGIAYVSLGEVQRAIDYYEQRRAIAQEVGDRRGESQTLSYLGSAYAALGEVRRAIDAYEQSLVIAREIGDRQGEAIGSWNLGNLLTKQGDLVRAIALMQIRVDYERAIGHADTEADAARVEDLRRQIQAAKDAISPDATTPQSDAPAEEPSPPA